MRLIQIKIILLLLLICNISFGQQEQLLRNGFVAATNNGVYYLMDGDNEWVHLGKILSSNPEWSGSYDSVFSVSFHKTKLSTYSLHINTSNAYSTSSNVNYLYGLRNTESRNFNAYTPYIGKTTCNNMVTNFKWSNAVAYFEKGASSGHMNFIEDGNSNNPWIFNHFSDYYTKITSIDSDNDSTFVMVGTNNSLKKFIISRNTSMINSYPILGLSSNVNSSHKIIYLSNRDEFIIMSDEGLLYSWNKVTVTNHGLHALSSSIYDIASDNEYAYCALKMTSGGGLNVVKYNSSYTVGVSVASISSNPADNCNIALIPSGYIGVAYDNNKFSVFNMSNGQITKTVNLPSGIVINDLAYINYLP